MKNKILAGIVLVTLAVSLTGCRTEQGRYATLDERIEYKNQCEEAGGTYSEEWWLGSYRSWDCRLTNEE